MTANGRVEPKTTQGCLPKSCHSLNLGMENFASILGDRFWPTGASQHSNLILHKAEKMNVISLSVG
jgi:hypothetical protein